MNGISVGEPSIIGSAGLYVLLWLGVNSEYIPDSSKVSGFLSQIAWTEHKETQNSNRSCRFGGQYSSLTPSYTVLIWYILSIQPYHKYIRICSLFSFSTSEHHRLATRSSIRMQISQILSVVALMVSVTVAVR